MNFLICVIQNKFQNGGRGGGAKYLLASERDKAASQNLDPINKHRLTTALSIGCRRKPHT